MRLIFRLVTEEGQGVFNGRGMTTLTDRERCRAYDHPGPSDTREGVPVWEGTTRRFPLADAIYADDALRFGFHTMTVGRSWFGLRACRKLAKAGCRLRVYRESDLAKVVRGNWQCVFSPCSTFMDLPADALWAPRAAINAAAAAFFRETD